MMKRLLISQIFAAILFSPLCLAEMHEFKSADGKKTVWAEVMGYDAETKQVNLKLANKKSITSPATAFSKEGQEYIEKAAVLLEAGRNLRVEFEDVENLVSEKRNPTNGYQTLKQSNGFELKVRNNGKSVFNGLKAEYQIFTSVYLDPFQDRPAKTDQIKYGTALFDALSPRNEIEISTETVPMTTIKRLPKSQCVGGT